MLSRILGVTVSLSLSALPASAQQPAVPAHAKPADVPQDHAAIARAMALDGTRWAVEVTPDAAAAAAGEKAFTDILVFAQDKVTMTACLPHGFAPSTFKLQRARPQDKVELVTEQTSPKAGKTSWQGHFDGLAGLRGELTMTAPDGKAKHFTFAGRKSTVLEGTTWTVEVLAAAAGDEDGNDPESATATLVFTKGTLAYHDAEHDFQGLAYVLTSAGKAWTLRTTEEDTGITLHGEITGTTITGKLELSADDAVSERAFTGRRTADAAAPAIAARQ